MRLPAELRLMVLRYLLVANEPISSREPYKYSYAVYGIQKLFVKETGKVTISGYGLTPSVICTCQRLAPEALAVLYGENTLQINIATNWIRGPITFPMNRAILHCMTGIRAELDIFGKERLLSHDGYNGWNQDKKLTNIASRFRNFVIKIQTDQERQHANQLRHMFHLIASLLLRSNVEVTISIRNHLSVPISTIPMDIQIEIAKAFMILRTSKFRFLNLTAPNTLVIQNIITSKQPAIDLEDFYIVPNDMLGLMIPSIWHNPAWYSKLRILDREYSRTIENFDVHGFLQKRFEVLQMWKKFVKMARPENCQMDGYVFVLDSKNHHVTVSNRLGLKVKEEGNELNERLKRLAKRHNFTFVVDVDALD